MKNLTTEEFDKAPKVIQFLHISDISKKITESNTIEAKAHYNKKLNDLVKIIEKWEDYCIAKNGICKKTYLCII